MTVLEKYNLMFKEKYDMVYEEDCPYSDDDGVLDFIKFVLKGDLIEQGCLRDFLQLVVNVDNSKDKYDGYEEYMRGAWVVFHRCCGILSDSNKEEIIDFISHMSKSPDGRKLYYKVKGIPMYFYTSEDILASTYIALNVVLVSGEDDSSRIRSSIISFVNPLRKEGILVTINNVLNSNEKSKNDKLLEVIGLFIEHNLVKDDIFEGILKNVYKTGKCLKSYDIESEFQEKIYDRLKGLKIFSGKYVYFLFTAKAEIEVDLEWKNKPIISINLRVSPDDCSCFDLVCPIVSLTNKWLEK